MLGELEGPVELLAHIVLLAEDGADLAVATADALGGRMVHIRLLRLFLVRRWLRRRLGLVVLAIVASFELSPDVVHKALADAHMGRDVPRALLLTDVALQGDEHRLALIRVRPSDPMALVGGGSKPHGPADVAALEHLHPDELVIGLTRAGKPVESVNQDQVPVDIRNRQRRQLCLTLRVELGILLHCFRVQHRPRLASFIENDFVQCHCPVFSVGHFLSFIMDANSSQQK